MSYFTNPTAEHFVVLPPLARTECVTARELPVVTVAILPPVNYSQAVIEEVLKQYVQEDAEYNLENFINNVTVGR
jgi:hypothetical protein